jgi:hypothetical protein
LQSIFESLDGYFEVVELEECSGAELKIYSIIVGNESETLYDKFLSENEQHFQDEVEDIINKLATIGTETGLKGAWYKGGQGEPAICYLFDDPDKQLRLYFILFGNATQDFAIVLGGGGHKPKEAKALQEVGKLKEENYLLRQISGILYKAKDEGKLLIDENGMRMEPDDDGDQGESLIFKLE